MTLSLVAVFIPLLFMPGLVGRLFREFAVTIGVAILVSGFVSLTLTPMLAAKFLKGGEGHAATEGKWRSVERLYQGTEKLYVDSLNWVMRHRPLTMLFSALTLAATVVLFVIIPKGFLPSEDTGRLQGSVEGPEGIGYDALAAKVREVGAILTNNPNVKFALMSVGGGGGGGSNSGRIQLTLVDRAQRKHVDEVMRELTRATSGVPGCRCSSATRHRSTSVDVAATAPTPSRCRAPISPSCTRRRAPSTSACVNCLDSKTCPATCRWAIRRCPSRSIVNVLRRSV